MLEILTLHLDGWFSHDVVTLDFERNKGITLIKGETGSGKSSILEALIYLFYGRLLRKKSSVKDFQNKVFNRGYYIWLDFRIGGATYRIEEGRDRGELDGLRFSQVAPDKKDLTADKPGNTRQRIEEKIGMNYDELTNLFVLGQRHSQALVEGTPGERGALLVQLFGMTRYDDAIKKVNEEIKRVGEQTKKLTITLETLKENLEHAKESEGTTISTDIADLKLEIDNLLEKKSSIESTLETLRERKSDSVAVLHTLKYAKSQAEKFEEAQEEEKEITKAIQDLEATTKGSPEEIESALSDLQAKLKRVGVKKANISEKLYALKRDLASVAELGDSCPITKETCPVNVPAQYREEREGILAGEICELEEKSEKYKEAEKNGGEKKSKLDARKKKFDRISSLSRDLLRVQKSLEQKPEVDDGRIEDLTDEIDSFSQKISEKKEKLESISQKIGDVKDKISTILAQEKARKDLNAFLNRTKAEIKELELEHSESSLESRYLSAALGVYKKIKLCRIDSVLALLEEKTNERLDKISGGRYTIEFLSQKESSKGNSLLDTLDILLDDGHKKVQISMASGGESAYVSVATLLSLYEVVASLSSKTVNLLFLDEIFGPLDRDSVARAFEEIVELANGLNVRVKVISHKDLNESLVTETWQATKESGITKMEISC